MATGRDSDLDCDYARALRRPLRSVLQSRAGPPTTELRAASSLAATIDADAILEILTTAIAVAQCCLREARTWTPRSLVTIVDLEGVPREVEEGVK